jgi:GABA permease
MWLFPWLSYATIALMAAVILAMAFLPSTQSQFLMSGVTLVIILVSFDVHRRLGKPPGRPVGPRPSLRQRTANRNRSPLTRTLSTQIRDNGNSR